MQKQITTVLKIQQFLSNPENTLWKKLANACADPSRATEGQIVGHCHQVYPDKHRLLGNRNVFALIKTGSDLDMVKVRDLLLDDRIDRATLKNWAIADEAVEFELDGAVTSALFEHSNNSSAGAWAISTPHGILADISHPSGPGRTESNVLRPHAHPHYLS
jgi:hypothetical protein